LNVTLKYEPLPKQSIFHTSNAKFRVLGGGMGNGKTTAGAGEVVTISLEHPKNLILVGRATYPALMSTTWRELMHFPIIVDGKDYEFGSSPLIKYHNKSEHRLVLINGTEILGRALLDSFDKIKSLNLGAFWVDELTEIPEEIWLGLVGRLRRKGVKHRGFGTTNPEGHDWVWKRWVAGSETVQTWEHESPFGPINTIEALKGEHHIVTTTSLENPYLPDGYVDSMIQQYPEEWVKRYVFGSFDTFSGLIYHEFRDAKPYVVPAYELPDDWYRFVAMDYGYRNPTAALWAAVSPEGRVYVYDEFYASNKLVSEIAEIVQAKSKGQNIQQWLIDPSTRNRQGVTGVSVIDEFAKYGLFMRPANNDVRAGINRVKEKFKLVDGVPNLVIFSKCVNLRTELGEYRWKDLKVGATQDAPEKPVKRNDHSCDALKYMISYIYDTPELKVQSRDWRDYSVLKRMRGSDESADVPHYMAV
jgi:PBSX family phage terminase large subunit